uniref:Uncharacterized protein n=1 Tax=Manihot esculenta TaxID=3983 RepID=A0A2C9VEF3_MANES
MVAFLMFGSCFMGMVFSETGMIIVGMLCFFTQGCFFPFTSGSKS